ncbi:MULTISPECIES: DUF3027 domain-containing protein [Actinotignum]|uniref:DUF3027 domain-containing protein n=1 Tax=Actinotignum TaxID=1653174 RepID=UPI00254D54F7|nr:DUF3027 domain-containing protein [Actinotignum schaalii]MDE1537188.1 DUF3027 domain-containing protein [Actinotignum schaalii]MDK7271231.1 DUF3027 domain-containing protein [Actinotignum schaalii]
MPKNEEKEENAGGAGAEAPELHFPEVRVEGHADEGADVARPEDRVDENVAVTPDDKRVEPQPGLPEDRVLAAAVDEARATLIEAVAERFVGEYAGFLAEDTRVVSYLFTCTHPGYHGWYWSITVSRASRARTVTFNEIEMLPGAGALLAPRWVPWSERLAKLETEKAQARAASEKERKESARAAAAEKAERAERSGRRRRVRRKITGAESETGAVETDAASPAAAPVAETPEPVAKETAAPANGAAPVIRRGRERTVVRGSRGRRYQATGALS